MLNDRQIELSVANTRYGPWQVQQCSLSEFYTRLSQPVRGQESRAVYLASPKKDQDRLKDVGGFVGGPLKDGIRKSGHVLGRDLITLDVDRLEAGATQRVIGMCEALGCGYAVYSTRKHAPEAPRLRILLPLAQRLTDDEYEPAARQIAWLIDQTMQMYDRTTFQAERLMYWPSVCSDAEYVFRCADKPLLDGHALLAQFPWQDVTAWQRCPDEAAAVEHCASKQQDPTEKEGIVGAFCRVYNVYSAMDKFIPGVYEPVANCDDRFTFAGGSTTGGAVVYEDGTFIYSNHATDPASGVLCNAFDMVRLHRFADLDNDAKPGTPVGRLPSWKAMTQLAEADAAVHDQKVSDRAASIKRDFAQLIPAPSQPVNQAPGAAEQKQTANVPQGTNGGFGTPNIDAVMTRLAELLEDDSKSVTVPLVETAISAMGMRVGRNEITGKLAITGLPAAYSLQEAPNTLPVLVSDFLKQNDVKAAPETVGQYLPVIADKCRFNPVRTWLSCYPWDGVDRWDTIFEILGITDTDQAQYRTYVRKWFWQTVALGCNDDYHHRSADGALVLQGPQGCGKTLFFRRMAVSREWFAEGCSIDFSQKDTLFKALGAWVSELGELDSTLKREQSALKAFITSEVDDLRSPYARSSVMRLRHTSFCGTVNPADFLRDETGSRRFWVVPVKSIDVDRLLALTDEWVHQLWLQAYKEWAEQGAECYRITRAERARLEKENGQFAAALQWQEEIEDLMDWDLPDDKRTEMTAAYLARNVLRGGATAVAVGRALARIAKERPSVECLRDSKARKWLLPLDPKVKMTFVGQ